MADIRFSCPHCGQHIEADEDMAGMELPCPTCKRQFVVPHTQGAVQKEVVAEAPSMPPPLPQRAGVQPTPFPPPSTVAAQVPPPRVKWADVRAVGCGKMVLAATIGAPIGFVLGLLFAVIWLALLPAGDIILIVCPVIAAIGGLIHGPLFVARRHAKLAQSAREVAGSQPPALPAHRPLVPNSEVETAAPPPLPPQANSCPAPLSLPRPKEHREASPTNAAMDMQLAPRITIIALTVLLFLTCIVMSPVLICAGRGVLRYQFGIRQHETLLTAFPAIAALLFVAWIAVTVLAQIRSDFRLSLRSHVNQILNLNIVCGCVLTLQLVWFLNLSMTEIWRQGESLSLVPLTKWLIALSGLTIATAFLAQTLRGKVLDAIGWTLIGGVAGILYEPMGWIAVDIVRGIFGVAPNP